MSVLATRSAALRAASRIARIFYGRGDILNVPKCRRPCRVPFRPIRAISHAGSFRRLVGCALQFERFAGTHRVGQNLPYGQPILGHILLTL